MDAQQLWKECTEMLQSQVSDATWKTWFDAIHPAAVTGGTVVLAVPSSLVRDRLEGRYRPLISDALADIVGVEVPLRLVVQADGDGPVDDEEALGPAADGARARQTLRVSSEADDYAARSAPRRGGRLAGDGDTDQQL